MRAHFTALFFRAIHIPYLMKSRRSRLDTTVNEMLYTGAKATTRNESNFR